MSDTTRRPEQIDQRDIWLLADTLPLQQVIELAKARAGQGEVASLAFLAMAVADESARLAYRRQAAEGGDLYSILQLAGQALARADYAQALLWFERAAAQGNPEAHVRLGIMLAKGHGVTPDPLAAITRICAARQTIENDTYLELVLGEQDYPFDLGDKDVYYTHVIERIFSEYGAQEKQQVYDYLHQLGIQAESEDVAEEAAPSAPPVSSFARRQPPRAQEKPVVAPQPMPPPRSAAPIKVAVQTPPITAPRGKVRFAPYQYNVTPVRCSNRACAWEGIMTQSDHQRCPLCKRYPLQRIGGWKLLNGSVFTKQRDSLLKTHVAALRTVAWYLYASPRDFQALAAVWGNAPYKLDRTR